jgi:5-methyltetrahydropteroyltriglutamate--homocysteine methyltransferase
MAVPVTAYQYGIYPRSEAVVAATRGLERGRVAAGEVEDAYKADREDFVAIQQEAGLDFFSDGLLRWQDIFRPLVGATGGLEARTLVRWFDNNSFFRAPEPTGDLRFDTNPPPQFEEGSSLPEPKVATLPSPFLFSRAAQHDGDRNGLMMDLARTILAPLAGALSRQGYGLLHLQEPWLPYFGMDGDGWGDLEKALAEIREAAGDATLILHTYFGDAAPYADRLKALPVDAIGIDFVQTDLAALGTGWQVGVLAGCLDGRSSPVESVDGTAAFIQRIAEELQPPALYLSSNCELEYLPRDIARQKVLRLGQISARAKGTLA